MAYSDLSKLEFRTLVESVVGKDAYLFARKSPAIADLNDTFDICATIAHADMTAVWNEIMSADLITQAQVDSIMAAWPVV